MNCYFQMSDSVMAALIGAFTAGIFTATGWFIVHLLSSRSERDRRRQEAALNHLQRQIEELYGPLSGLLHRSNIAYEIARQRLPQNAKGGIDRSKDSKLYDYFVQTYFLPIDSEIAQLIQSKLFLLESNELPESFQEFLRHYTYLSVLHRLWQDKGVDSSSVQGVGYPKDFDKDVREALFRLQDSYRTYLKKLTKT